MSKSRRGWIAPTLLLLTVLGVGAGLAVWKRDALRRSDAAAASVPEPAEAVTVAVAGEREHRRTTTSIGTIMALRSISLRIEMPGTVRKVHLTPGQVVEEGAVLVALDVAVEEAELKAQKAQAVVAESQLERMLRAGRAASAMEVDRARAERDVALAQIARTEAIIARKTIRAPFRARIGMSDVHVGQYLEEGTPLTTLQGVDDAAHVDFTVAQQVAAALRDGDTVEVVRGGAAPPVPAKIVAIDSRVDPATRNAMVRARLEGPSQLPAPGASVRVRVPAGPARASVVVPVSALRKGPEGDHVFVIAPDKSGKTRASLRRVESGTMLGDDVVIHSGLTAGETVAASGSFKLRDSALVAVVQEPAPGSNGGG